MSIGVPRFDVSVQRFDERAVVGVGFVGSVEGEYHRVSRSGGKHVVCHVCSIYERGRRYFNGSTPIAAAAIAGEERGMT